MGKVCCALNTKNFRTNLALVDLAKEDLKKLAEAVDTVDNGHR